MKQAGTITKKWRQWYIVYRTPEGKQKWEGGYKTKALAQARLTQVIEQMDLGIYAEPSAMTFGQFVGQWLKNRVSIAGATSEGYESYLKAHVGPELGEMGLREIRHSHIQDLITMLAGKKSRQGRPLAPATVRKIVTMLGTIFAAAVRHDLIRIDPTENIEIPKAVKAKIEPPSKQDIFAILTEAGEYQPIFLLDAVTGMRRGEILALAWKHIDWIAQEVMVERSIVKARGTDGAHKWTWKVGPTKSGRVCRIGIPASIVRELEMLRATARATDPEQFIFGRNGTFMDPEYFSKWIALPLIRRATEGRVRRFHDLRHFFASILIEQGESIKYIQDQLGHASATMTLDVYGHLMPQAKKEAARKPERTIFGTKANFRTFFRTQPKKALPETVN